MAPKPPTVPRLCCSRALTPRHTPCRVTGKPTSEARAARQTPRAPQVIDTRETTGPDDITIVTVVSPDRFAAVQRMRELWAGPLVVLLYQTETFGRPAPADAAARVRATVADWPRALVLHYVQRTDRRVQIPINALRNAATDRATTRYLFPVDADFLPSAGLHAALRRALPTLRGLDAFGIVVPHWEVAECRGDARRLPRLAQYPATFPALLDLLRRGVVRPFHADLNFTQVPRPADYGCPSPPEPTIPNPEGVRLSGYEEWLAASLEPQPVLQVSVDAVAGVEGPERGEPICVDTPPSSSIRAK